MRAYELAWFFPLLTVGLYVLFRRLASRGAPREPRVAPVVGAHEPLASPGPTAARAAAIGRLVLVGAVLGVELVLSRSQTSAWIRDWLVPATLVYAALAAGLAFALARWQRRPFWLLLATVNAAATVLTDLRPLRCLRRDRGARRRRQRCPPLRLLPALARARDGSRAVGVDDPRLAPAGPRRLAAARAPRAARRRRPGGPLPVRRDPRGRAGRIRHLRRGRVARGRAADAGRCLPVARPPHHPRPLAGHPPADARHRALGGQPLGRHRGVVPDPDPAQLDRALRAVRLPVPAQLAVSRRHADRRRHRRGLHARAPLPPAARAHPAADRAAAARRPGCAPRRSWPCSCSR